MRATMSSAHLLDNRDDFEAHIGILRRFEAHRVDLRRLETNGETFGWNRGKLRLILTGFSEFRRG